MRLDAINAAISSSVITSTKKFEGLQATVLVDGRIDIGGDIASMPAVGGGEGDHAEADQRLVVLSRRQGIEAFVEGRPPRLIGVVRRRC